MREINSFTTKFNTRIVTIKDSAGNKFIVKQDIRKDPRRHLSAIRDVAAAEMAQVGAIPANRVLLIPAGYAFPGKAMLHFPATVHTFAPGMMVKVLPKADKAFVYIHQSIKPSIAKADRGFNMRILKSMASNGTLARITAGDTFTANGDRHHQNYFYSQKSNEYHAIDMESCFDKNLAIYACRVINGLVREKNKSLTDKEIEALKIYHGVLKVLLRQYTAESMHSRLMDLTNTSGILKGKKASAAIMCYLDNYKNHIRRNYASCKHLVSLLETLFKKYGVTLNRQNNRVLKVSKLSR